MIFQYFPKTNAWGHKFNTVKRSKINLQPSFEQNWQTLSAWCYTTKFSLKAFFGTGKEDIKVILPCTGMAAILFNGAEPL